jgi:hypothetical protein
VSRGGRKQSVSLQLSPASACNTSSAKPAARDILPATLTPYDDCEGRRAVLSGVPKTSALPDRVVLRPPAVARCTCALCTLLASAHCRRHPLQQLWRLQLAEMTDRGLRYCALQAQRKPRCHADIQHGHPISACKGMPN